MQAEQARTQAAIGVAQAAAMADVSVNSVWAAQAGWIVMALCITAIILAILYWRGRVAVQTGVLPPTVRVLSVAERHAMREFAVAHDGQIVYTPEGKPLLQLSDGKRRALQITQRR